MERADSSRTFDVEHLYKPKYKWIIINQLNIYLLTVKEFGSKMSLRIDKLTYPETSHPNQPIQYNFSSKPKF